MTDLIADASSGVRTLEPLQVRADDILSYGSLKYLKPLSSTIKVNSR